MIPTAPDAIQSKSFAIIDDLLATHKFSAGEEQVIKRVIHATGDISWAEELIIHPEAIKSAYLALKSGADIITDVHMVKAGINRQKLNQLGGKTTCWIRHKRVAQYAKLHGITRAAASMRLLGKRLDNCILAIGNAPSALQEMCQLIDQGKSAPAVIVGIPVGFVGAAESKETLRTLSPVPYITNPSRRGGSSIAVAIVNALLALSLDKNNLDK